MRIQIVVLILFVSLGAWGQTTNSITLTNIPTQTPSHKGLKKFYITGFGNDCTEPPIVTYGEDRVSALLSCCENGGLTVWTEEEYKDFRDRLGKEFDESCKRVVANASKCCIADPLTGPTRPSPAPKPDPVDVPAIQETVPQWTSGCDPLPDGTHGPNGQWCAAPPPKYGWTCRDKSRTLLETLDGKTHYCHRPQLEKK